MAQLSLKTVNISNKKVYTQMDSEVSITRFREKQQTTIINNSDDKSQSSAKNGSSSFGSSTSDDDSDIESDLVSTINYNTVSSLAALKDALQNESESDSSNSGTFFQRYFQNHSSSLPSRNAITYRRLSQCREEDEDEEKKDLKDPVPSSSNISTISGSDKSLSESSSGSKTSVIDTVSGPTHKFVITKIKQPSEAAKNFANRKYHPANTVNFPPTDPKKPSVYSIFKSPLVSPHYDHKFFDSSLIEMKSQTSSSSTIDYGSAEDIWVKRPSADLKRVSD